MRDFAGWMRCPSASKSCRPCGVEQHDLAVEHVAALRELELGEVARERPAVARLQVHVAAVDERDRAEAVPLGLVDPAVAGRQRARGLGELGQDRRGERQRHGRAMLSGDARVLRTTRARVRRLVERDAACSPHASAPAGTRRSRELIAALRALPPARTLDVACGTAFLRRHLPGAVTGLDASAAMLAIARGRLPGGELVQGDALDPPFPGRRLRARRGRSLLRPPGRAASGRGSSRRRGAWRRSCWSSTRRAARTCRPSGWTRASSRDGSRHEVFKRWFEPDALVDELGGGTVVHAGGWFVAVLA